MLRDRNGWPVDLARLPSWERSSDYLLKEEGLFLVFECPCRFAFPGATKRRRHRLSDCPDTRAVRETGQAGERGHRTPAQRETHRPPHEPIPDWRAVLNRKEVE